MLTLVDIFSRWGVAIPLQNIKASSVVKVLRRHAVPAGMGRPNELLIDGGSESKGEMQEACKAWGSHWRPHTPYHNESAGAIERFNKTLELRVAHFAKEGACTWVDALALATEAYNGSMHASLNEWDVILTSRALVREKDQVQLRREANTPPEADSDAGARRMVKKTHTSSERLDC